LTRTPLIDGFQARHPGLRIELVMSDYYLDLAKGEADIAIRAGQSPDENLVGRKIGETRWAVYASRSYVERCAMAAAGRQTRHDGFGRRSRLEVAAAISKTDDGIGVADVDPFRVIAGWVEGDAERPVKPLGENARRRRLPAVRPQHPDAARFALGGKDVAVWRHADEPLMRQA
jgi:DNA-binding transcriptional LysR family regulator